VKKDIAGEGMDLALVAGVAGGALLLAGVAVGVYWGGCCRNKQAARHDRSHHLVHPLPQAAGVQQAFGYPPADSSILLLLGTRPRRPRAVLSPQQSAPEEKQQQQQLTLTLDAAHAVSEATPSATSVSHPAATLSADEEEETEVEATLEHVVSAACAAAINCRSIIPTR
jgi:hypothetical protein